MSIPTARIQSGPATPVKGGPNPPPLERDPDHQPDLPLGVVRVAELVAPAEGHLVEDRQGGPPRTGTEMNDRADVIGTGRLPREEVVPRHVVEFAADAELGREAVGDAGGLEQFELPAPLGAPGRIVRPV